MKPHENAHPISLEQGLQTQEDAFAVIDKLAPRIEAGALDATPLAVGERFLAQGIARTFYPESGESASGPIESEAERAIERAIILARLARETALPGPEAAVPLFRPDQQGTELHDATELAGDLSHGVNEFDGTHPETVRLIEQFNTDLDPSGMYSSLGIAATKIALNSAELQAFKSSDAPIEQLDSTEDVPPLQEWDIDAEFREQFPELPEHDS